MMSIHRGSIVASHLSIHRGSMMASHLSIGPRKDGSIMLDDDNATPIWSTLREMLNIDLNNQLEKIGNHSLNIIETIHGGLVDDDARL